MEDFNPVRFPRKQHRSVLRSQCCAPLDTKAAVTANALASPGSPYDRLSN
jgi:hypothetical protein